MTARVIDAVGAGLTAVALWSIVGIGVALHLDSPDTAWKFVAALVGSGLTLVALNLFERRCG